MKNFIIALALLGTAVSHHAFADQLPAPEGAKQYFVNLSDGDVVTGPVKVVFGLSGMGVAPAGVDRPSAGHHHILLNRPPFGQGEDGEEELTYGVLSDENHIHYGKGQTEAVLDLPAGTHTLQLVLGDMNHVPFNPPIMSEQITITVN